MFPQDDQHLATGTLAYWHKYGLGMNYLTVNTSWAMCTSRGRVASHQRQKEEKNLVTEKADEKWGEETKKNGCQAD